MTGDPIFTPELLETCISCGFCLPACPTYLQTGQETSSPRGRINLMRALETGELGDDSSELREEASFCLGCRACEPVCPAGVQYGALLEEWRSHLWKRRRRPLVLWPLLWSVNRAWRVRLMGLPRPHARLARPPARRRPHARRRGLDAPKPSGLRGPPALLMLGCFERALFPGVSRAAQQLDPSLDAPTLQGCCGALHAHNGELDRGRELARELGRRLPGTIVTTSGGCAAHLAQTLGRSRVIELSEWLIGRALTTPSVEPETSRPRIALQDSCHLRNGLGVSVPARELISLVGEYVELPSSGVCCGAAGTYALLRPADSRQILEAKLAEIRQAQVEIVVAVNPGCYRQLKLGVRRAGLAVEVIHLAELLARAGLSVGDERATGGG